MQLSIDQQEAIDTIENGGTGIYFLTGKAGCGKTTVVRNIKGRKMITALTGLAASILEGRTLHSLLSMSPNSLRANYFNFTKRIQNYDYLIIDEVSMLSDVLFEEVLTALRYSHFQGKLLLVGDFKQLPPVNAKPCYKSKFWSLVKVIELTTFHRQSDSTFIEVLNYLRDGLIPESVKQFLLERVVPEPPRDYTAIVPTREKADRINKTRLNELTTPAHLFDMKLGMVKRKLYDNEEAYYDHVERVTNFKSELTIKIGTRLMTVINNPKDGYVNGTVGTVITIDSARITLLTDNGRNIYVERVEQAVEDGGGKMLFTYIQFPVMPAWATTIHKSQGQSIEKLYVDMSNHFEKEMTYVAISRGTNPETLKVGNYAGASSL